MREVIHHDLPGEENYVMIVMTPIVMGEKTETRTAPVIGEQIPPKTRITLRSR